MTHHDSWLIMTHDSSWNFFFKKGKNFFSKREKFFFQKGKNFFSKIFFEKFFQKKKIFFFSKIFSKIFFFSKFFFWSKNHSEGKKKFFENFQKNFKKSVFLRFLTPTTTWDPEILAADAFGQNSFSDKMTSSYAHAFKSFGIFYFFRFFSKTVRQIEKIIIPNENSSKCGLFVRRKFLRRSTLNIDFLRFKIFIARADAPEKMRKKWPPITYKVLNEFRQKMTLKYFLSFFKKFSF